MGCFLVPGMTAIATTIAQRTIGREKAAKLKFGSLNAMLWGGTAMLVVDHAFNGEVTAYPPFLTAMGSQAAAAEMLREMATLGAAMTAVIFGVWLAMLAYAPAVARLKARQARESSR